MHPLKHYNYQGIGPKAREVFLSSLVFLFFNIKRIRYFFCHLVESISGSFTRNFAYFYSEHFSAYSSSGHVKKLNDY